MRKLILLAIFSLSLASLEAASCVVALEEKGREVSRFKEYGDFACHKAIRSCLSELSKQAPQKMRCRKLTKAPQGPEATCEYSMISSHGRRNRGQVYTDSSCYKAKKQCEAVLFGRIETTHSSQCALTYAVQYDSGSSKRPIYSRHCEVEKLSKDGEAVRVYSAVSRGIHSQETYKRSCRRARVKCLESRRAGQTCQKK